MPEDAHPEPDVPDTPWPVPERSDLSPDFAAVLVNLRSHAMVAEDQAILLVKKLPVKRDEEAHAVWLHDMALVLDVVDQVRAKVVEVEAFLAEAFCRALPFGTQAVTYADVPAIKPHWGGDRKGWKNDLLQADVMPHLLVDDDGVKRTTEDAVETTLSVVSLIGSNVKTGGLKKLGLDPDDYCHKTPKPPSVEFVR